MESRIYEWSKNNGNLVINNTFISYFTFDKTNKDMLKTQFLPQNTKNPQMGRTDGQTDID